MVSTPYSHYILGANGKPEPVPEDEEVMIEETEMVDNEEENTIENQDNEVVELVANQAGYNLDLEMMKV